MNSGYALNQKKRISMFTLAVYDMNEHCMDASSENKAR